MPEASDEDQAVLNTSRATGVLRARPTGIIESFGEAQDTHCKARLQRSFERTHDPSHTGTHDEHMANGVPRHAWGT